MFSLPFRRPGSQTFSSLSRWKRISGGYFFRLCPLCDTVYKSDC